MFGKSDKKKGTGTILLGFATLMFGMDAMSGAVEGLADIPAFQNLFIMFKNPILGVLCRALNEVLDTTLQAFVENDVRAAIKVEPLEQVVDELKTLLRDSHIVRLRNGDCTVEAGFIWSDLLTNLERTSDHCSNVAACILETNDHHLNMHESVRRFKRNSSDYKSKYEEYRKKYEIIH